MREIPKSPLPPPNRVVAGDPRPSAIRSSLVDIALAFAAGVILTWILK